MAQTFKAQDGVVVKDGETTTLSLAYDSERVVVTGTVRFFEQTDRVYDAEGIAIGTNVTTHWEISTDDPAHPAIGFRPENVLTKTA
jgi:hypothetical protein